MTMMTNGMRIPLFLALLCACGVTAEIRSFSGVIEAASSYVHYSDGYLVAPGYVDISGLNFASVDYVEDEDLDDDETEEDDDIGDDDVEDPNDGGDRLLDDEDATQGSDGSVVRT